MKAHLIVVAVIFASATAFDSGMQGGIQNVMQLYSMQQFSSLYATSLLELQASWMWMNAADSMEKLAIVGASGESSFASPAMGLEEGASSIEHDIDQSFLEVEDDMAMLMEHETEKSLLALVKLQYIQAANRLGASQESHYQVKAVVARIASAGGAVPQLQTLTQTLYYRDMLELITTCVTIQKQDIWNFWIFNEMVETEMFNDGSEMPDEFGERMAVARLQAMSQFQMQAGLELASMVMDFYIQQTVAGLMAPYVAQMQGTPNMMQMPQGPYAQGTSFLETETSTGAGTQFVPSMALGGLFGWQQFLPYMKFYTAWIKYYVASELAVLSQVDAMSLMGKDTPMAEHKPRIMASQTMPLLKQWTQLRLMLSLYDFYSLTGAASGGTSMMAGGGMAGVQQAMSTAPASNMAMWQQMPPQPMMPQAQMPPQMGNPMRDFMSGAQYLMAEEPTAENEAAPSTADEDSSLIAPPKTPKLTGTQIPQLDNSASDEPNLIG